MGVVMELCHKTPKIMISSGNDLRRCGIWLHTNSLPPGLVLVSLSFQLGVAVMVQFDHWDWGL